MRWEPRCGFSEPSSAATRPRPTAGRSWSSRRSTASPQNRSTTRTAGWDPSRRPDGSAIYVGYVTVAGGRVDLDRFHEPFWGRCRDIAARARALGIYVEFDLVDRWVRQHGADDLPEIDPWRARNNVQGLDLGGLGIFQVAPRPVHERWIRKAVFELGAFENVLFQVGNEGFKSWSAAWELGVYSIVKDELGRHGYADRLVATNTHEASLESRVDYATRHSQRAQDPGPYPILVNEYATIAPAEVERQVTRAEQLGDDVRVLARRARRAGVVADARSARARRAPSRPAAERCLAAARRSAREASHEAAGGR